VADVERTLRRLWSAALADGDAAVGNADDFFAAGGDSLAATELAVGLQQELGVEVSPGWLYEHPRFGETLAVLERLTAAGPSCDRLPLGPHIGGRDHPMSAQQQGLAVVLDRVAGAHRYQAGYAAILPDPVDAGAAREAIGALGLRHTALRTAIRGSRQVIEDDPPPMEVLPTDASGLALAREWASVPIAVDDRHLTRFALVTGASQTLLVMAAHQMVTDPWSWGVLLSEFASRLTAREPADGPPLQYSDYARWQQAHLTGAGYERDLAFWRGQCAGIPATGIPLPGAPGSYPGAGPADTMPVAIPARVAKPLRLAAQKLRVSVFHLLLAVFQISVARWTGSGDVLIGTATANRHLPGTGDIPGYFVNGRVTRGEISRRTTVAGAAVRVRDEWALADAHRELHLEPALIALGVPDLVNVKFSMNAIPTLAPLPSMGGRALRAARIVSVISARRAVSVALAPDGDAFRGTLMYRSDIVPVGSAATLIRLFSDLAGHAAVAVNRPLTP